MAGVRRAVGVSVVRGGSCQQGTRRDIDNENQIQTQVSHDGTPSAPPTRITPSPL